MEKLLNIPQNVLPQVEAKLEKIFNIMPHNIAGRDYQDINRQIAQIIMGKNELNAIQYLVESHAPDLLRRAAYQYERCDENGPVTISKDYLDPKCSNVPTETMNLIEKLSEMPEEWSIVQLTPVYEVHPINETPPIHITVLKYGNSKIKPFCVTVDRPRSKLGELIDLVKEIEEIKVQNKKELSSVPSKKNFRSMVEKRMYMESRAAINNRLKNVVKLLEDAWLREWKCLLTGSLTDSTIDNNLQQKLGTFLEENNLTDLSDKNKMLIKHLAKGMPNLNMSEIGCALEYIIPNIKKDKKQLQAISKSLKHISDYLLCAKAKKHPLILIIDEKLDPFPWEMINTLVDHPVSRMPSFKLTYALFKEHEKSINDGVNIDVDSDKGTYILNPGLDLSMMEKRLAGFFKYWKPNWEGLVGQKPTSEDFEKLLTTNNIFSYNGHGDGTQFFSTRKIEKIRINAVVLLFGCSSVKLTYDGPQVEMIGSHQLYLIACSPCVLGMLWEVTDVDTDVLTTEFLSRWLPSKAEAAWPLIDKGRWEISGEIVVANRKQAICLSEDYHEPELLKALSKARKHAKHYLTKAGCVVRGLPVKIKS